MNNQFLQHLKSITPQGRAENTNMFIPTDKLQEGSRGIVRHERIMRSKNVKNTQEKDRQQISRERRRAGLSPQIPSSSINKVITSDEGREGRGSIYRTKSIDKPIVGKNPKDVAAGARVPKAVKKYRDASSAKGRLGRLLSAPPILLHALLPRAKGRLGRLRAVREETSDISEGSRGAKKAIRVAKSLFQKGNTMLGQKYESDLLHSFSKGRKQAGMNPRMPNTPVARYVPSEKEYAVYRKSAAKGRLGKNIASLSRAVREETSKTPKFYKKLKKVKKAFRRTVRGMANILQKPSDASDVMITGRTF